MTATWLMARSRHILVSLVVNTVICYHSDGQVTASWPVATSRHILVSLVLNTVICNYSDGQVTAT